MIFSLDAGEAQGNFRFLKTKTHSQRAAARVRLLVPAESGKTTELFMGTAWVC
jgi:hypothetical protein